MGIQTQIQKEFYEEMREELAKTDFGEKMFEYTFEDVILWIRNEHYKHNENYLHILDRILWGIVWDEQTKGIYLSGVNKRQMKYLLHRHKETSSHDGSRKYYKLADK